MVPGFFVARGTPPPPRMAGVWSDFHSFPSRRNWEDSMYSRLRVMTENVLDSKVRIGPDEVHIAAHNIRRENASLSTIRFARVDHDRGYPGAYPDSGAKELV